MARLRTLLVKGCVAAGGAVFLIVEAAGRGRP